MPAARGRYHAPVGKQPSAQRPVRQQLDAVRLAIRRHLGRRPHVHHAELHLVGRDGDPRLHDLRKVRRVEVGERQLLDLALLPQRVQVPQRREALVHAGVVPPVELHGVQARRAHPAQGNVHSSLDLFARHPLGTRHPFGQRLKGADESLGLPLTKQANEVFRRAIMVGQVKGCVASRDQRCH